MLRTLIGVFTAIALIFIATPSHAARPSSGQEITTTTGEVIDSDTDWRLENFADGSQKVVFGPGAGQVPESLSAVSIETSPGYGENDLAVVARGALTEGAGWYCSTTLIATPAAIGGNVQAKSAVSCFNRPGKMWISGQLERSSWSGWRAFSSMESSTSTSAQSTSHIFKRGCGSGGTYDYRLKVTIKTNAAAFALRTSPAAGSKINSLPCGPGIS